MHQFGKSSNMALIWQKRYKKPAATSNLKNPKRQRVLGILSIPSLKMLY